MLGTQCVYVTKDLFWNLNTAQKKKTAEEPLSLPSIGKYLITFYQETIESTTCWVSSHVGVVKPYNTWEWLRDTSLLGDNIQGWVRGENNNSVLEELPVLNISIMPMLVWKEGNRWTVMWFIGQERENHWINQNKPFSRCERQNLSAEKSTLGLVG